MPKAKRDPSDLELQILGVLWQRGPSTVQEILETLSDGKDRGYTSVLSVVQSMQRKKLVSASRPRNSRAYKYSPKRTRESVLGPLLGGLVKRVFGGDPAAAVQQLLTASDLDQESIARLREVIDAAEDKNREEGE